MTRLSETEARIESMGELREIVGAMRGLAGMHMQDAQRVLPGIRRHAEAVATGIADALLLMGEAAAPAGDGRAARAVVLCTAEHGFVGGFNEKLVDEVASDPAPGDRLFVLGSRGAALAAERGLAPVWTRPMATRCSGAGETVEALTVQLYRRIAAGEVGRVEVVFARYRRGTVSEVERRLLLPLDAKALASRRPRQPPLHNLAPAALYEKLAAEYVFTLLTEAAIESIASENAARFATMDSAHDNVTRRVEELSREAHRARQAEITQELLELMSGADVQLGEEA